MDRGGKHIMEKEKTDQESVEPLMIVKGGITLDKYKLSNAIKESLKDVEFDLIIDSVRVIARRKIVVEESETQTN